MTPSRFDISTALTGSRAYCKAVMRRLQEQKSRHPKG
jgi:hypothetical protein